MVVVKVMIVAMMIQLVDKWGGETCDGAGVGGGVAADKVMEWPQ